MFERGLAWHDGSIVDQGGGAIRRLSTDLRDRARVDASLRLAAGACARRRRVSAEESRPAIRIKGCAFAFALEKPGLPGSMEWRRLVRRG